jgi:hypothetical protein
MEIITTTNKLKIWKKLTKAATSYLQWVAAITGTFEQTPKRGSSCTNLTNKFSTANPKQRQVSG